MNDLVRTVIIGFLSGVAGAMVVFAVGGNGDPHSDSQQPETASVPGTDALLEPETTIDEEAMMDVATAQAPRTIQETRATESPDFSVVANQLQRRADRALQQQQRFDSRLRDAGWSDAEIDALHELQENASLEAEKQQYESMRKALEKDPSAVSMWKSRRGVVRNSMSAEKYEQYLEASGRPTTVMIDNVLSGSAAESAGLRPGDQIVRYGSERVFDENDLMMAIIQGEPGDSVTVEVRRDGATFHVAVARGPLGTSRMARIFGGF